MRTLLGRIGEWAVTRPAAAIAGVVSIVAIVGVVGALQLSPDAGTDKLVDNGSAAFEGTQEFRQRFGDDAIVVLVKGNLDQLVLTDNINRLFSLEQCLSGSPDESGRYAAEVCQRIRDLGATRVVFGPATFLNEAATRANAAIQEQVQSGMSDPQALQQAQQQLLQSGLGVDDVISGLSINNTNFVQSIVYDQTTPGRPPKSKFGYLFPSDDGALVSIRLQPDISDDDRREAISLIREAVADPVFKLKDGGSYEISGIPVVVQGLADELGGEIFLLFAAALVVMALVLIFVFGPPLRLLPLLTALGSAAFSFGLLSLLGGTLTMASVAVLPVVIGLAVDYAIQLQARFREAAESGERPPAAAVIAALRGGPVIGTAALATAVGFLSLVLSPIPMIREFAIALVAGIAAALLISLTAGLAALSMTRGSRESSGRAASGSGLRSEPANALHGRVRAVGQSARGAGRGTGELLGGARRRAESVGHGALAASIERPGRVLLVAGLLAVTGWVAGTGTKVVSDIRQLVPGDLPALQSVDDLQDATGVSGELDILVSGDVTSPESITWMSTFKKRVLEQHGFGGVAPNCRAAGTELCPGPALSDLFDLSSGEAPSPERVAAVLKAVPPYFSQAILSRTADGDVASLSFLIPVMPLDEQEALIDDIRSELDPPAGISAEVVGLPVLAADANSELSGSRYWLTLVGLIAVGLVLLAVYRSPSRALVPLLPIALATGWSALVLEAIDIPLNPMSATLGALVIAITTEFSVILSARYYEEREGGASIGEALRLTYARTGTAVLASGITSIAGFGVLAFSGITMLRDFGLATIVDLSVALAGVMLVLPAALVWAEEGFSPLPAAWRALRPAGRAEHRPDPTIG
ncbi:MAG: MMPL family transporter [Solirubrobacterales bacterium]|nr:MMPL family transporter [Solirubrobacterales bacterium]